MSSSSIYFGVSSVSTSAMWTGVSCGSIGASWYASGLPGNSQIQQNGSRPQCGVCAKSVDRFKVTDAGSMNILVVAYCHTEEEARVMPRDNLGIVAVPKGYVAFAEKARALIVEAVSVERPTVRLITLEEHDEKTETGG